MQPTYSMQNLITHIEYVIMAIAILLLPASCSRNSYKPIDHDFNHLLGGRTAVDTLFVHAIGATTEAEFDAATTQFFDAYAHDFDDPGLRQFSAGTPYSTRQDSLLFYMQDYLLNVFRYDESIKLGCILDERLSHSNTPLHSAALGDIAVAYFYMGNLDEAIKYQRTGYEIDLRLSDPQLMSSDLNQLAAICLRASQYDLARDYILDAIKVEEPLGRSAAMAIRYGLASEIFLKLKDYPTAANYARKALHLDRQDGRDKKVGIRLSQLAAIQLAQNDNAGAEKSLVEALPLLEGNTNSLAIAYCQLGELALKNADNARAQQRFQEALSLCRSAGIKPIEKRALQGMWLSMKDGNRAQGAEYLEHYAQLSDSLSTADSDSQLANLKAEYATRELRLDNERLEAQNRTRGIIIVSSAILLLLLCLLGWLIYRNRLSRQRLMRKLEQVRLNFFTNITHEFRTPLTVILGMSSQLEKKDAARQQAELISQEGRNLLGLVNQLLDIGKISSAAGHADWRHGNVIGYLNMLVESLRPLAVSRDVELLFSPANNEVEMDFVPDYMRKIVVNILSNALKFTRDDGRVLISARVEGARLVMRFADNGTGINAADLGHIFEPFYQGTNSKTEVGSGVGLSLVKLLVEAMNGEITVKSSSGIGSVFIITLPLRHAGKDAVEPLHIPETAAATPQAQADDLGTEEEPGDKPRRQTVLIVEDNVNVANYMASQLSTDYHVCMARNGEEGYNKALNIVPDLIFTDIMMPVMDGIELLKKLRQSDILNHLPVVVVTARASDADRIEGISSGADAYISKPFNADELRAVAARLIAQRQLLCEKYRNMSAYIADTADAANDNSIEDRAFIGRLINVIYHLIANDHRTDMAKIASHMNMSERSLARKVQALAGESTVAFVNRVKIDKAKRMLNANDSTPLADVAIRCGFDDPAYFSRIFKQIEGVSPTTYRRHVK